MRRYRLAELPDGYEWLFVESYLGKKYDKFVIFHTEDQEKCGAFFPDVLAWKKRRIVHESKIMSGRLRSALRSWEAYPPDIEGYRHVKEYHPSSANASARHSSSASKSVSQAGVE